MLSVHRRRSCHGLILAIALIVSACGAAPIDRSEAIGALETTGVTEAEATCIADSLIALQQLDAADPRQPRTNARREALVSANARCVTPDVLGATATQVVTEGNAQSDISSLPFTPTADVGRQVVDETSRRDAAIDRLTGLGRTPENATCIVDHLLAVYADAIFEDENFGLGLDPYEATAFAVCL